MSEVAFNPFADAYSQPPYVEAQFQLNRSDLISIGRWKRRIGTPRTEKYLDCLVGFMIIFGVGIVSALIAGFVLSYLSKAIGIIGRQYPALLFGTLFLFCFWLLNLLFRRVFLWAYATATIKKVSAYKEKVVLRLNDYGVWSSASDVASFHPWSSAQAVEQLETGIVFLVGGSAIFFVPNTAFDSERDLNQFLQFALERRRAKP
jgi:hypothetical protein